MEFFKNLFSKKSKSQNQNKSAEKDNNKNIELQEKKDFELREEPFEKFKLSKLKEDLAKNLYNQHYSKENSLKKVQEFIAHITHEDIKELNCIKELTTTTLYENLKNEEIIQKICKLPLKVIKNSTQENISDWLTKTYEKYVSKEGDNNYKKNFGNLKNPKKKNQEKIKIEQKPKENQVENQEKKLTEKEQKEQQKKERAKQEQQQQQKKRKTGLITNIIKELNECFAEIENQKSICQKVKDLIKKNNNQIKFRKKFEDSKIIEELKKYIDNGFKEDFELSDLENIDNTFGEFGHNLLDSFVNILKEGEKGKKIVEQIQKLIVKRQPLPQRRSALKKQEVYNSVIKEIIKKIETNLNVSEESKTKKQKLQILQDFEGFLNQNPSDKDTLEFSKRQLEFANIWESIERKLEKKNYANAKANVENIPQEDLEKIKDIIFQTRKKKKEIIEKLKNSTGKIIFKIVSNLKAKEESIQIEEGDDKAEREAEKKNKIEILDAFIEMLEKELRPKEKKELILFTRIKEKKERVDDEFKKQALEVTLKNNCNAFKKEIWKFNFSDEDFEKINSKILAEQNTDSNILPDNVVDVFIEILQGEKNKRIIESFEKNINRINSLRKNRLEEKKKKEIIEELSSEENRLTVIIKIINDFKSEVSQENIQNKEDKELKIKILDSCLELLENDKESVNCSTNEKLENDKKINGLPYKDQAEKLVNTDSVFRGELEKYFTNNQDSIHKDFTDEEFNKLIYKDDSSDIVDIFYDILKNKDENSQARKIIQNLKDSIESVFIKEKARIRVEELEKLLAYWKKIQNHLNDANSPIEDKDEYKNINKVFHKLKEIEGSQKRFKVNHPILKLNVSSLEKIFKDDQEIEADVKKEFLEGLLSDKNDLEELRKQEIEKRKKEKLELKKLLNISGENFECLKKIYKTQNIIKSELDKIKSSEEYWEKFFDPFEKDLNKLKCYLSDEIYYATGIAERIGESDVQNILQKKIVFKNESSDNASNILNLSKEEGEEKKLLRYFKARKLEKKIELFSVKDELLTTEFPILRSGAQKLFSALILSELNLRKEKNQIEEFVFPEENQLKNAKKYIISKSRIIDDINVINKFTPLTILMEFEERVIKKLEEELDLNKILQLQSVNKIRDFFPLFKNFNNIILDILLSENFSDFKNFIKDSIEKSQKERKKGILNTLGSASLEKSDNLFGGFSPSDDKLCLGEQLINNFANILSKKDEICNATKKQNLRFYKKQAKKILFDDIFAKGFKFVDIIEEAQNKAFEKFKQTKNLDDLFKLDFSKAWKILEGNEEEIKKKKSKKAKTKDGYRKLRDKDDRRNEGKGGLFSRIKIEIKNFFNWNKNAYQKLTDEDEDNKNIELDDIELKTENSEKEFKSNQEEVIKIQEKPLPNLNPEKNFVTIGERNPNEIKHKRTNTDPLLNKFPVTDYDTSLQNNLKINENSLLKEYKAESRVWKLFENTQSKIFGNIEKKESTLFALTDDKIFTSNFLKREIGNNGQYFVVENECEIKDCIKDNTKKYNLNANSSRKIKRVEFIKFASDQNAIDGSISIQDLKNEEKITTFCEEDKSEPIVAIKRYYDKDGKVANADINLANMEGLDLMFFVGSAKPQGFDYEKSIFLRIINEKNIELCMENATGGFIAISPENVDLQKLFGEMKLNISNKEESLKIDLLQHFSKRQGFAGKEHQRMHTGYSTKDFKKNKEDRTNRTNRNLVPVN